MVTSYIPADLNEALAIRAREPVTLYGGGTDLMIEASDDASYIFLGKLPELRGIRADDSYVRIGSECTFTEIIENSLTPAILREAASGIGGPAIRNLGTIGGNIGNGSPKADSVLILFAANASVVLQSERGDRTVPVRDFYLGKRKIDLKDDEIITEVLIPRHGLSNYSYTKIGARKAQAISRVAFAGILDLENGRIKNCSVAFGAVSDKVVCRPDIDAMLIGLTLAEASEKKAAYLEAFDKAIVPIAGRISAEYRKTVCMNLLKDFMEKNGI